MKKILSLDVGTKTIGLALGFIEREMAQPLYTLVRKSVRKDTDHLQELCVKQNIDFILVGLPLELSGEEGRSARLARQVGDMLAQKTELGIAYHDERFSTVEAEKRLMDAGKNAKQRKEMIDQVAAMVILEDWWRKQ